MDKLAELVKNRKELVLELARTWRELEGEDRAFMEEILTDALDAYDGAKAALGETS